MLSIQKRITKTNYNKGNNREIKYIVLHYVGAVSSAEANCKYFEKENRHASAHYFVDEKSIWQCVNDEDIAWHVGAKQYFNECRNSNSIGVELCCKKDSSGNWYFEDETVNNAVELVKMLMAKYSISQFQILRHYDTTHKMCPEPWVRDEQAWLDFKARLVTENVIQEPAKEEEEVIKYKTLEEIPDWGKPTIEKLVNMEIVKGVSNDNLGLSEDMVRMYVSLDRARLFD